MSVSFDKRKTAIKGSTTHPFYQALAKATQAVDGTVYHVSFDDWMYLIDEKVMINKAVMSKWGLGSVKC